MRNPLTLLFILFVGPFCSYAQLSADLEGSYLFSIPYNVVRIPATGGTQFDLAQDLTPNTTFAFRARANYTVANRHVVSILAAPLTIQSKGSVPEPIVYSGQTFAANAPLEATYMFNSYRLTYRYLFLQNEKWKIGAGLTGKVRHANITLKSGSQSADFPDLGVVPLVHFYANWSPNAHWLFLLEGDALATKVGRAEDVFVGLAYRVSKPLAVKVGYRVLEGGADVSRNYNFSFIQYACLGLLINY